MTHEKQIEDSKLPASHEYGGSDQEREIAVHTAPLASTPKGRWERSFPVLACGAGLFSDGYLNGVIGSVTTMLRIIYGKEYTSSSYKSAVPSIAFAGTVVGHLFFGVLSPAGSVGAAESTGELKKGHRNRWFILATDFQIDLGFVVSAFVPMLVVLATGENHLRAAWRICLALGALPPLSLLWLRLTSLQNQATGTEANFSAYSFGIFASSWLVFILPTDSPLWKSFGMATAINSFWLPGALLGAFLADWIGPKWCLVGGVSLQGIVGFAMTGAYSELNQPSRVAGFIILTGIFMALGEVGPGDNIGLFASKLSSTPIRGQFYGVAAAWGKVGAFVGTYVFPLLIDAAGDDTVKQGQYPFWVSSSLCIFSAVVAFFGLPNVGQDMIEQEDERFKRYLEQHGYDTSMLGTKKFREETGSVL
ncbi:glycerophosphoinositol permease [Cladophialophora chaetospira]|uniref:Glycerophosphoinositol permease n=1 Tax=Cladophialophora chaetospira TaxID=386627 RepID=A0AA39CJ72_9EURO|nr:glycerophosphoinositol permease [Cladophialophora chaetospira]